MGQDQTPDSGSGADRKSELTTNPYQQTWQLVVGRVGLVLVSIVVFAATIVTATASYLFGLASLFLSMQSDGGNASGHDLELAASAGLSCLSLLAVGTIAISAIQAFGGKREPTRAKRRAVRLLLDHPWMLGGAVLVVWFLVARVLAASTSSAIPYLAAMIALAGYALLTIDALLAWGLYLVAAGAWRRTGTDRFAQGFFAASGALIAIVAVLAGWPILGAVGAFDSSGSFSSLQRRANRLFEGEHAVPSKSSARGLNDLSFWQVQAPDSQEIETPFQRCMKTIFEKEPCKNASERARTYLVRMGLRDWQAQDVVADAALATCLRLPNEPCGYFFTVATNKAKAERRREKLISCEIEYAVCPLRWADEEVWAHEMVEIVRAHSCRLSETDQRVITVAFETGRDYPLMAARLEMTVPAVRQACKRAFGRLRDKIREQCPDDVK